MKHTPGPWRVSNNELGYEDFDILASNLGWENLGIATLVDARFSDPTLGTVALDRDTLHANARLIAAAPDLLDALETLAADNERMAKLIGETIDELAHIEVAYAAIAKAKGE